MWTWSQPNDQNPPTDITKRRQTQDELIEERERLATFGRAMFADYFESVTPETMKVFL